MCDDVKKNLLGSPVYFVFMNVCPNGVIMTLPVSRLNLGVLKKHDCIALLVAKLTLFFCFFSQTAVQVPSSYWSQRTWVALVLLRASSSSFSFLSSLFLRHNCGRLSYW